MKPAQEIRRTILDEYYDKVYSKYLFRRSCQSIGIAYFENALESVWDNHQVNDVLELGGGSGEHLIYFKDQVLKQYISLDLRPRLSDEFIKKIESSLIDKVVFEVGDAESLTYSENSFDRVFSTCLLHHVNDPLAVLLEARRVTRIGGEIAFLLPTDPGVLNQIVKRLISYPRLRKLSRVRPELVYAITHPNHIGALLELIKLVFEHDNIRFVYKPFLFHSSNLNLLVVAHATKSNS